MTDPTDPTDPTTLRPPVPTLPGGHGLLEGKVVVITAAAGTGIGFATAQRCVEEGATVVVSDAHERRLGEAAAALAALPELKGEPPLAVPCDVTDEAQVQRLYDAAAERHGHFDVAVNNAGLGGKVDVVDMTDEQWSLVLDITLTGTFRCTRAALRHFYDHGQGGVIVNNASVLGWRAQAGQAHYAAAKAGVMALNRVMPDDELAELSRREAFGRGAEVGEVATVIAFLASDYASYMTGEVVSVSSQHP